MCRVVFEQSTNNVTAELKKGFQEPVGRNPFFELSTRFKIDTLKPYFSFHKATIIFIISAIVIATDWVGTPATNTFLSDTFRRCFRIFKNNLLPHFWYGKTEDCVAFFDFC